MYRLDCRAGYGPVGVHFTIRIDGEGLMEVTYTVTDMPYPSPRKLAVTSSIISHQGGYDEVGIEFHVSDQLDTLSWKKKGLLDVYPEWHIGRLEGETTKYNPGRRNPSGRRSRSGNGSRMNWTGRNLENTRSAAAEPGISHL